MRMFVALFLLVSVVATTPSASADVWGANYSAAILKTALEKITRQIEGVLLGAMKQTAMTVLNSKVARLVGGSSVGGSRVITDWRSYLYTEPQEKVRTATDDFIRQMTSGRGSSASYEDPYGGSGYSLGGGSNYSLKLKEAAEASVGSPYHPCAAQEYFPDFESAMDEGDLRALNIAMDPSCNTLGMALQTQEFAMNASQQEQMLRFTQSISHGYKSVEDAAGLTLLPGSTVGRVVSDVQDIGAKIIAAASNPAELAGGVIAALVNQTLTNMIEKGIGNVQANINKEIRSVDQKISGQFKVIDKALGPVAGYVKEVKQQTNVITKPSTNPGAAIPRTSI